VRRLVRGDLGHRQHATTRRRDSLHDHPAVDLGQRRPQHLVPLDQRVHRTRQRRLVQRSRDPDCLRRIVGIALGELREPPEPLLTVRRLKRAIARHRHQRRRHLARRPPDQRGERAQRGRIEHRPPRQLDRECLPHTRHHLHREQRFILADFVPSVLGEVPSPTPGMRPYTADDIGSFY
jgi:hypothetical protein